MNIPKEQKQMIEDMIERRVKSTGETRKMAAAHIAKYLEKLLDSLPEG